MPETLDTSRSYATVAESQRRTEIRESIKSCTRCMACYNGNGPVLPSGPTPNDIMILGEAPTRTDDRQGSLTFKGDAGLLLRTTLERNGFDLDRLFFANAVSCWPETAIPDRNLIACVPNVKAQIEMCQPKIVLSLGAVALKITSDRKGRTITKDHGQPFVSRAGPFIDLLVFPTWHPAALAHTKSAETMFAADMSEFARLYREEVRA